MAPPKESLLSKYFYPLGFAVFGFGTGVVQNYYLRRPYYSGIQRHLSMAVAGAVFGYYVDKYYERKWSERDATVRHYIELHPEDFEDKRKKYKEIFDEWYPMR